jgi:hypothetical protein
MKISQIRNGTCTVWAVDQDTKCPSCRIIVKAGTTHNCETQAKEEKVEEQRHIS